MSDNSTDISATTDTSVPRPIDPKEVYENKGLIISIGRNYLDRESCEDLVQEVAIKCLRNERIRYDASRGPLTPYLARIARNVAADMWRANRRTVPTDPKVVALAKMDEEEERLKDVGIWWEEDLELLEHGLRELYLRFPSKTANSAFELFACRGMRAKDVAKKLGVEERFVNVAVHRGMKRLKAIVLRLEREDFNGRKAS